MTQRPLHARFHALVWIALCGLLAQMTQRQPSARVENPVITLIAIPGLQFDQVRFAVKPREKVTLIFRNGDDMSHNLVFTVPGKRQTVVEAAGKLEEMGPPMNYVPDSPDVLWSIPVLPPGEEQSITFVAPDRSGVYPYVCTFPGHGYFMYGAMYVSDDGNLPALENDPNIPSVRQKPESPAHDVHTHTTRNHPFDLKPPYLYRAYMEDASPASVAVHLPHHLSYCWDTDACILRYAWEGGFVDNAGLWKGKPNAVARVLGTVFYRSRIDQPIRADGDGGAVCRFKGYRLLDRYPEFHYTVGGLDVYELVRPRKDGSGLIRTFRIPDASKEIWFVTHPDDGVIYETSVGRLKNNKLVIAPEHARSFSIEMIIKKQ